MPCGFGKILPIFKATDLVFWGLNRLNEFSKVTKRKIKKKSYTEILVIEQNIFEKFKTFFFKMIQKVNIERALSAI